VVCFPQLILTLGPSEGTEAKGPWSILSWRRKAGLNVWMTDCCPCIWLSFLAALLSSQCHSR